MGKNKELFQNAEIKIAFGLGFCIILLAFVSKKILHIEISYLSHAAPGLIALGFEALHTSKNKKYRKYARPLYWNIAMIAVSVIILASYAYKA